MKGWSVLEKSREIPGVLAIMDHTVRLPLKVVFYGMEAEVTTFMRELKYTIGQEKYHLGIRGVFKQVRGPLLGLKITNWGFFLK